MAQDWPLPIAGISVSSALTDAIPKALETLRTVHSGTSAPSAPTAYMLWCDTSNNVVKMRDASNASWVTLFSINERADRSSMSWNVGPVNGNVEVYWRVPVNMTIERLVLMADTATSGSSTGSAEYTFDIKNETAGNTLFSTAPGTGTAEVSAHSPSVYTPDQNTSVAAGDMLTGKITVVGAGPSVSDWTLAAVSLQIDGVVR